MKSPAITATLEGKNRTLYLQVISVQVFSPQNYIKSLISLNALHYCFQSATSIEERMLAKSLQTLKGILNECIFTNANQFLLVGFFFFQ